MAQTCAGRTAVVIPAYKPDDRLPPYVQALKDAGIGRIVVVDDGSGQDYQRFFDQIPRDGVSHVISYRPTAAKGWRSSAVWPGLWTTAPIRTSS